MIFSAVGQACRGGESNWAEISQNRQGFEYITHNRNKGLQTDHTLKSWRQLHYKTLVEELKAENEDFLGNPTRNVRKENHHVMIMETDTLHDFVFEHCPGMIASKNQLEECLRDWCRAVTTPNWCSNRTTVLKDEAASARTSTLQFGTFAAKEIRAGQCIGQYVGELSSVADGDEDENSENNIPNEDSNTQDWSSQQCEAVKSLVQQTEYQIIFSFYRHK
jgi:hypothetical protein